MCMFEPTPEAAASTVLMWLQAWLRLLFGPKKKIGKYVIVENSA